jgi:hypothetical protein
MSRSDSAHGRGELSPGRSPDPRRTAEARNRHFGTRGLAVSARPPDHTVTNLAYFLRDHLADRTFIWPVLFGDARGDDVVVDASDGSARPIPLSSDGSCASTHWARVDWDRSLQRTSRGVRLGQHHFHRTGAHTSTGRDQPVASEGCNWPYSVGARFPWCLPAATSATDGYVRRFAHASSRSAGVSLASSCNRVVNVVGRPNTSFGPPCWSAT